MQDVAGGHIAARALREEGVTHLFTLCGGHIQHLYDGCLDHGIRVVDTRHEQTAGHAADGWARVTGVPGVAAVTAGPGVTDAVTAVANARRAQVPMILIGGGAPRQLAGRGSLQDMDHVTLLASITKWSVSVPEARRLAEHVQDAFRVATSGVPGPVFLEMPLDILAERVEEAKVVRYPRSRTPARAAGDPGELDAAAAILRSARRPVIVCGSQLRWSRDEGALGRLAEALGAPVFTSGMARGSLAPEHPWQYRHARKEALGGADAILVVGAPLDFRLGYGQPPLFHAEARLIQVDLDGAEIGRNRSVDVGITGDSALVMDELAARLGALGATRAEWRALLDAAEETKAARMAAEAKSDAAPPAPLRVLSELDRLLRPDSIVIGDGGDFVASAAYALTVRRPGMWLDPGPLGTLGIGPGFAMAAKLARPASDVVLIYGDGSCGLHLMEFEALVRQGIKVTAVVGNDACWTQIRRFQVECFGAERAPASGLSHARYDQVVAALGGHGEWVERPEDLAPALERALAAPAASLVNVRIAPSDFRKGAISI
jgi:acetolactate synthase-1/2/3 large subunit